MLRPLLCALMLVPALAGCVSVLPEQRPPEALYRIAATGPLLPLPVTVTVREPEAPQIMAGRDMVREDETGAIRLIPQSEWSGRATRLMQLAIIDRFSGGEGGAVLPESGVSAAYEMSIRLKTLAIVGESAVCEGSASLVDARSRDLVAKGDVRVVSGVSDDLPRGLKAVSEQCAGDFAAFLQTALMPKE